MFLFILLGRACNHPMRYFVGFIVIRISTDTSLSAFKIYIFVIILQSLTLYQINLINYLYYLIQLLFINF